LFGSTLQNYGAKRFSRDQNHRKNGFRIIQDSRFTAPAFFLNFIGLKGWRSGLRRGASSKLAICSSGKAAEELFSTCGGQSSA
jgi:hypothetical protein